MMSDTLSAVANVRIIDMSDNSVQVDRLNSSLSTSVGMAINTPRSVSTSWRFTATIGMELQSGDIVIPNGAIVMVQCPGAAIQRFSYRFSLSDVDCWDGDTNPFDGKGEDDFVAFLEGTFIYGTQVMGHAPMLRWTALPNESEYQVQVWDCGSLAFNCTEMVWETTVAGTVVDYGGLPLQSGRNYELRVAGLETEQAQRSVRFRPMDDATQGNLNADLMQLQETELNPETQAIVLAQRYLEVAASGTQPPEGAGLVWEAIVAVEAVVVDSETPYVHQLLGDAYLQVGWLEQAEGSYSMAVELSEGRSPAALVGLANVAAERRDLEAAEQWLRQARVSYAITGDAERLLLVTQWLSFLD